MPPEGVEWKPHGNILTYEQIIKIVNIMAGLGVSKIRVTGGEPLLRRRALALIDKIKSIKGVERVTLTTNGTLLNSYLADAEIFGDISLPDAVNISLDALDERQYKIITRCEQGYDSYPKLANIYFGIDRLLKKDIPVKINCVPVRSVNEGEIIPLTLLAKDKNIIVRFIELMPLGSASGYQFVSGTEVAARIEKAFGKLEPYDGISGSGPATYYSLPGFIGKIGFINALTHSFCQTCNRLRLTSEGFLKPCLSNDLKLDLRTLLRNGASEEEIVKAITELVAKKPKQHSFSETHPDGMSKIGG